MMPYISLYRKYRSQTFDDVVGQDHVVRTIKNAIKAGHVAHGYLFCGSRGTGKTTVARLIAKALNCLSSPGPTPEPCNKCEACVSITAGGAVDVIEMDAASNRGVRDMELLREGVKYPPMRLRYKVHIIDEAHQLSSDAKDAFLKTLEEPPPHAVFILATTEAGKIPITIRSRCQQFDFRRGTVGEIEGRLKHVITGEGISIEDDAVELISRLAAGSYRDSLSVLEQVAAYTEGTITAKDVYTVVGAVDEDVLLEVGDVVSSGETSAAFDLADRLLREGGDVRELLRSAANHFRDLLALKVGADSRRASDPRWKAQSESYPQDRLLQAIDVFAAAEKDLRYNEQHRLGLEMALLKSMARPAPTPVPLAKGDDRGSDGSGVAPSRQSREVEAPAEPTAVPDRSGVAPSRQAREGEARAEPTPVSAAQTDVEPAPVPVTIAEDKAAEPVPPGHDPYAEEEAPPTTAPEPAGEAPKPVTLGDIQRNWQKILMHLQKVMKGVSEEALARVGSPIDLQDSLLTIGFAEKHKFHRSRTEQSAEKIAQAIQDVMGVQLKVNAIVMGEPKSEQPSEAAAAPLSEAQPPEHPQKNDILTMFDGKEVEPGPDPWK